MLLVLQVLQVCGKVVKWIRLLLKIAGRELGGLVSFGV